MYRYDPYALMSADKPIAVETFVAPDDFNPDAQELNILKAFQKYKGKDKSHIYSIVDSVTTTKIPGYMGVRHVYSENGGAYKDVQDSIINWTAGSKKRHVIAYTSLNKYWPDLPLGMEWLYFTTKVGSISAYQVSDLKYIHCESLATVDSIKIDAFNGCNLTGRLTIPPNVKEIGDYSFANNSNLQYSIIIPDGVTRVGAFAFFNCQGFTGHIYTPSSVKVIGSSAFRSLSNAQGPVYLSENLEEIGPGAFMESSSLKGSLEIPIGVTKINPYTFYGCAGLDGTLALPSNLTLVDEGAFTMCGLTGPLHLPQSLGVIGASAFAYCKFTGPLQIGTSVTVISNRAFYNCTDFTGSLVIPDNVTMVASYAFANCTGLNGTLTLGAGVTQLYGYTFSHCGFTGTLKIPNTLLKVTDADFYKTNFSSLDLGSGIQEINCTGEGGGVGPFMELNIEGPLNLPASLNYIGEYAFKGCTKVTKINNPSPSGNLTYIGDYAFDGCTGLTGYLSLNDKVTNIGMYAFRGCTGLVGLQLPSSLTTIQYGTFKGCTGLTGTLQLKNVTDVMGAAFAYCSFTALPAYAATHLVNIGGGPTDDSGAFAFNKALKTIPLLPKLKTVGANAFHGCDYLNTVTLGVLTLLDQGAFSYCTALRDFTLGNTDILRIGDLCFKNCTSLATFTLKMPIPPPASDNVVDGVPVGTCVLYVPAGSIEYYQVIAPWLQFVNVLEL